MELPTLAVVSPDGSLPPSLTRFSPRVVTAELSEVRSSDDVVILHDRRSGDDIARLHRMLGRGMPAVVVTTRILDEPDIIGAFDNGATSYFIVDEVPEYCIVDAVIRAASGESSLSPSVVRVLLHHVHRLAAAPGPEQEVESAPEPDCGGDLTYRERQIMELLVVGHTIAEIARALRLTTKTVRNNLSNIYAKLHVRRQSEAILLWLGHDRTPSQSMRETGRLVRLHRPAAAGA